jgi:hypothetical protein
VGGTPIEPLRGQLIVRQTLPVQRQIAELLDMIRTAKKLEKQQAGEREQGETAAIRAQSSPTQRIERALEMPVTVDCQDVPLADAAAFLEERSAVPIVVDRRALEDVGLSTSSLAPCPGV